MVAPRQHIRLSILRWYQRTGRALPWRETTDPYAIAVSETMLQQTQVSRVVPKYEAWLQAFPTIQALAKASTQSLLKHWSGLGYNSRALRLQAMAKRLLELRGWPRTKTELQALPGFGPYTAGAVAIFAFRTRDVAIDTNIRRVFSRIFFGAQKVPTERQLEAVAESMVPNKGNDAWHHSLMDLGAMVCVSGRPKCEVCPVRDYCRAYPKILAQTSTRPKKNTPARFLDSDRFWRGRIVAFLIDHPRCSKRLLHSHLAHFGTISTTRLQTILEALAKSSIIEIDQNQLRLAQ